MENATCYMPNGDRCVPPVYAVTQYYTYTIVANQIKYCP